MPPVYVTPRHPHQHKAVISDHTFFSHAAVIERTVATSEQT
jgi:hypothetical protein